MAFSWSRLDESVGEGFRRIAREQVGKARAEAARLDGSAAERIHNARKHCKRLRGLFRLVRSDFEAYRAANDAVRDAAAGLSGARDAAVLLGTLAALHKWDGRKEALPEVQRALDTDEEEAALRGFLVAMDAFGAETLRWRVDKIGRATLCNGLERTYRQARKARRMAEQSGDDELFHEWRKLAKYHAHHLALLRPSAREVLRGECDAATELAEVLGQHHDLAVLRLTLDQDVDALGVPVDMAYLAGAIGRRQADLAGKAFGLADQVFAETPEARRARFSAYWSAWQDQQDAPQKLAAE